MITTFPEDSMGNVQRIDIALNGFVGFQKYRSFLLYDDFPNVTTEHLDGRKHLTESMRDEIIMKHTNH